MRLINADALLNAICGCFNTMEASGINMTIARAVVTSIANNTPAVDAVPVVRCEDCKWWHKDDEPDPNGRCECDCNGGWWLPEEYCSCGERREE